MQLSQKRKIISQFFLDFLNVDSILNIFRKKMSLIADAFLNLWTAKNVVRSMSKKSHFRRLLQK